MHLYILCNLVFKLVCNVVYVLSRVNNRLGQHQTLLCRVKMSSYSFSVYICIIMYFCKALKCLDLTGIIGNFEVRAEWICFMKKDSICNTINDKILVGENVSIFAVFQ